MYEIYCRLRDQKGFKDSDVARITGITKSTFSDWKSGRSNPKNDKLQKIADCLGVSISCLLTGEETSKKEITLTSKDERDISRRLEQALEDLEGQQEGLMFDGEPLDDETKELLKISLENSIRIAKLNAKQKFTPKKYRKTGDN